VLKPIAEEVGNHLFNFASDKFATHVARRVLCMLCGSDVLPGGAKGPQAEKAAGGEGEEGAAGVSQVKGVGRAGEAWHQVCPGWVPVAFTSCFISTATPCSVAQEPFPQGHAATHVSSRNCW
jgi:hypothetical protein